MSEKEIGRVIAGFVAFLLILAALGIRGCVTYSRTQETACRRAGGALMTVPGSTREMCAKVTQFQFEFVPLAP